MENMLNRKNKFSFLTCEWVKDTELYASYASWSKYEQYFILFCIKIILYYCHFYNFIIFLNDFIQMIYYFN